MAEFRRGERETMNFVAGLHRIKCPTLVMVGEDDPMTPVPCSEEIVAALPPKFVRFERFAGAGHGIVQISRNDFSKFCAASSQRDDASDLTPNPSPGGRGTG